MILVLSPAKTLDESPSEFDHNSAPAFLKETKKLVSVLKKKSTNDLMNLMHVSEKIAVLNKDRFKKFKTPFSLENSKQAIFAFKGDVYLGFNVEDLNQEDLLYAQNHVRILSGLYGLLKPLDLIQPYRLEMGTRLSNGHGTNLYEFWGDKITNQLNKEEFLKEDDFLINLASLEYFKSIKKPKLKSKVINIHFKEDRNGALKVISFTAKKARGAMAKQIVKKKINKPEQLKKLKVLDYKFNSKLSDEQNYLFIKK